MSTKAGPQTSLVIQDRTVERGRGCWNCIHANTEKAADLWWNKAREAMLARGIQIATSSPIGENDPRVRNLRKQIPALDHAITAGQFVICAQERSGADFTALTFLCEGWTGKQGASLATQGQSDLLPAELLDKANDN